MLEKEYLKRHTKDFLEKKQELSILTYRVLHKINKNISSQKPFTRIHIERRLTHNSFKQETTEMFVKIRSPSVRTTDTAFSNIYGSQNR